jgi:hypothetical protein
LRVKAAVIGLIAVIAFGIGAGAAAANANAIHAGVNGRAEQSIVAAGSLILPEAHAISANVGRARIVVLALNLCLARRACDAGENAGTVEPVIALAMDFLRRVHGAGAVPSAVGAIALVEIHCLFVRSSLIVRNSFYAIKSGSSAGVR